MSDKSAPMPLKVCLKLIDSRRMHHGSSVKWWAIEMFKAGMQFERKLQERVVVRIAKKVLKEVKAEVAYEDKLERALLMVRNELCFGGDWETAIAKIDNVLGRKSNGE